jgi:PhnB protein
MATVNAYLTFNGTCEAAFDFYKSVFGGEFTYMGRFNEMPPAENQEPISDELGNLIMHVSLPISAETTLYGSDTSEAFGHSIVMGDNISISINASSREEANKLYTGLSADGVIKMPLSDTFWGAYFGMFTDKFGIHWMMNFDENPES